MASRQLRSASSIAVACNKEASPQNYIGHRCSTLILSIINSIIVQKLNIPSWQLPTRFFLEFTQLEARTIRTLHPRLAIIFNWPQLLMEFISNSLQITKIYIDEIITLNLHGLKISNHFKVEIRISITSTMVSKIETQDARYRAYSTVHRKRGTKSCQGMKGSFCSRESQLRVETRIRTDLHGTTHTCLPVHRIRYTLVPISAISQDRAQLICRSSLLGCRPIFFSSGRNVQASVYSRLYTFSRLAFHRDLALSILTICVVATLPL